MVRMALPFTTPQNIPERQMFSKRVVTTKHRATRYRHDERHGYSENSLLAWGWERSKAANRGLGSITEWLFPDARDGTLLPS